MRSRLIPVILLLLAPALCAQEAIKMRFVRASGEAVISAKPDRAQVNIGVATHASTAAEASSRNAADSTQVLKAIQGVLGSGGQVKTGAYSVSPQYEYINNRPPKLTGYEATNTVIVTVDELSLLGKVIDSATATGANNINGVSFTLRDDAAVRAQVLAQAALKARANAEAIAKALNVSVVGVVQAEPSEVPVVRPLPMAFRAAAASTQAPTPIEAGDLDIHASVTVTLEIR